MENCDGRPQRFRRASVGACRYCHGGIEHDYQFRTRREYDEACAGAVAKEQAPPSNKGGYGYRRSAQPHPDCPECDGLGSGFVHAADTAALQARQRCSTTG